MLPRVWLNSCLVLAACASGGSTPSVVPAPATGNPSPPAAAARSEATSATPPTAATDARIARLKRSFDCDADRASGVEVCTVKDGIGGSLVRKRIEPVVVSTGVIHLRSVYRDRDWIYHDHVVVRIGDAVLRSEALPATSPDVSRRVVRRQERDREGYIAEQVSYRGRRDNGIVRAIAGGGSSEVVMQLAGGPRTFEKSLSDDEKRLFAEAYELAQLFAARAPAGNGARR
jgi:hypothetical protein